jgi:hypothetical protein
MLFNYIINLSQFKENNKNNDFEEYLLNTYKGYIIDALKVMISQLSRAIYTYGLALQ